MATWTIGQHLSDNLRTTVTYPQPNLETLSHMRVNKISLGTVHVTDEWFYFLVRRLFRHCHRPYSQKAAVLLIPCYLTTVL